MAEKKLNYKDFEHLTLRQLAYLIKQVDDALDNADSPESKNERRPRFAFFLGAGASFQSNIKGASQMMEDFKNRIFERDCDGLKTDEEKNDWLEKQNWYKNSTNKYSSLFNRYDDNQIARQRYIEKLIKKGEASFGYLVLSYLLRNNYINTILTTNFDDLAYISCVTYTGIRPVIYAYGIMASEMRISTSRPKIFKLHGDYLYSKLINTEEEMEKMSNDFTLAAQYPDLINRLKELSLIDQNMSAEVQTIVNEYGLIVAGFDGNDKSIRDIFKRIPYGRELIWCYWKPNPPNQEVLKLVQEKNGKLVAIDGFDEMMSEIEKVISLKEDKLIADIDAQKNKIRHLIAKYKPEFIQDFVSDLVKEEPKKEKDKSTRAEENWLHIFYRALDFQNKGDDQKAEELYRKVIKLNANDQYTYNNLANILYKDRARAEESEQMYRQAIKLAPTDSIYYNNLGALLTKDKNRINEAETLLLKAIELKPDYAEAYNNLGFALAKGESRWDEAEKLLNKAIELNPYSSPAYDSLGFLLSKDRSRWDEAEKAYRKALELNADYEEAKNHLADLLKKKEKK